MTDWGSELKYIVSIFTVVHSSIVQEFFTLFTDEEAVWPQQVILQPYLYGHVYTVFAFCFTQAARFDLL